MRGWRGMSVVKYWEMEIESIKYIRKNDMQISDTDR